MTALDDEVDKPEFERLSRRHVSIEAVLIQPSDLVNRPFGLFRDEAVELILDACKFLQFVLLLEDVSRVEISTGVVHQNRILSHPTVAPLARGENEAPRAHDFSQTDGTHWGGGDAHRVV